jgi:hypothetical protein
VIGRACFLGLLVALIAAASASAAATSAFKVTRPSGKSQSFKLTGFEFSGGLHPKLGASGKIEVDALIASKGERALLSKGSLKAATLHIVATLPKKINKTYTFGGAKITEVSFVTGHAGPTAVVELSYKKLTAKTP